MIIDSKFKPGDIVEIAFTSQVEPYIVKDILVREGGRYFPTICRGTNAFSMNEILLSPWVKKRVTSKSILSETIVIDNKFEIGQTVYIATDTEQAPCIVTGIIIPSAGKHFYKIKWGKTNCDDCYEFQLSATKNILIDL